jgi:hypothetical protein
MAREKLREDCDDIEADHVFKSRSPSGRSHLDAALSDIHVSKVRLGKGDQDFPIFALHLQEECPAIRTSVTTPSVSPPTVATFTLSGETYKPDLPPEEVGLPVPRARANQALHSGNRIDPAKLENQAAVLPS